MDVMLFLLIFLAVSLGVALLVGVGLARVSNDPHPGAIHPMPRVSSH